MTDKPGASMSTPEWKTFLDAQVLIKSFDRICLIVRLDRAFALHQSDRWEWSVVDQVYKHVLIDGEKTSREEAMLHAENAAKDLAQALMPLLEEKE